MRIFLAILALCGLAASDVRADEPLTAATAAARIVKVQGSTGLVPAAKVLLWRSAAVPESAKRYDGCDVAWALLAFQRASAERRPVIADDAAKWRALAAAHGPLPDPKLGRCLESPFCLGSSCVRRAGP